MLEITLVLLAVVSVGLVGVLVTVLTPPLVTVVAMATMCLGLVVGRAVAGACFSCSSAPP